MGNGRAPGQRPLQSGLLQGQLRYTAGRIGEGEAVSWTGRTDVRSGG